VCIGAYRKTEERRKKNSRKRSGALAEQKETKLISEALTNYFLRKGVGYLQLSTRSPPLTPSLYLFASEAAAPPPPSSSSLSFVNQLDRTNTLMKKNIKLIHTDCHKKMETYWQRANDKSSKFIPRNTVTRKENTRRSAQRSVSRKSHNEYSPLSLSLSLSPPFA